MFRLFEWITESYRKPERLFAISIVLVFLFRTRLLSFCRRQSAERMERENNGQPAPVKDDENGKQGERTDADQNSDVRAEDMKSTSKEETPCLKRVSSYPWNMQVSNHANSSVHSVERKCSPDRGNQYQDGIACEAETLADSDLIKRLRQLNQTGKDDYPGVHDRRERIPTLLHIAQASPGSNRVTEKREDDIICMHELLKNEKRRNEGIKSATEPGQGARDLHFGFEIKSYWDEPQPSGSGHAGIQGGVQPSEDQPGSGGEMPPKRKRRTSRDDTKTKKSKEDSISMKNYCDDLSKPFSIRKCKSWFQQYAGKDDPETIGPEGIEKLCQDLAVDPENIVMLVIAWKLQAETLGFFKFTEWSKGMCMLECDSTVKLKASLGSLKLLVRDSITFKKIYRYAFDFCRNSDQRTLDIDTSMAMLKVLLQNKWPLLDSFITFLQQPKYKVMNRDQWCNVLEFSRSIEDDLSNYDEDGAWPVLMDEFVEWYRANHLGHETSV